MKKILIIEDNEDNLDMLTQMLEDDYNVLDARNAEQGITLAKIHTPDLILTDISLPGIDGLTVTHILKNEPRTSNIPIFAVTAHAMKGDKEKVLLAGCNEYITKPIDFDVLLGLITKYIGNE